MSMYTCIYIEASRGVVVIQEKVEGRLTSFLALASLTIRSSIVPRLKVSMVPVDKEVKERPRCRTRRLLAVRDFR
jgi:L-lactate utilization protein LutC